MASDSGNGDDGKSSGTAYGQAIADGQATVTFASAMNDLFGRPISTFLSKKSAEANYRAKLGEWVSEAIDDHGRFLQPMLRVTAFEEHLVREEGCPKPIGTCNSTFAWAQLLFALNIRPGMGVVTWRQPPKALQPGAGQPRLVMDGAVLCHIVNLFRDYRDPKPSDLTEGMEDGSRSLGDPTNCTFPFGTIDIGPVMVGQSRDAKIVAIFDPGSLEDLNCKRIPFSYTAYWLSGTQLKFEKSSLMAKYLNAVYYDVPLVDSIGIGPAPSPRRPLKDRCDYFLQITKLIASYHQCGLRCEKSCSRLADRRHQCPKSCHMACAREGDWSKPCVVTRAWLQDMERIKRRVTTNGGSDLGLLKFLVQSLMELPLFIAKGPTQPSRWVLPDHLDADDDDDDEWGNLLYKELRSTVLFADDRIGLGWNNQVLSVPLRSKLPMEKRQLVAEIPSILANISVKYKNDWFYQLSDIKDEVGDILGTDHYFVNKPVLVLELGPSHPFWKAVFEIKAE